MRHIKCINNNSGANTYEFNLFRDGARNSSYSYVKSVFHIQKN